MEQDKCAGKLIVTTLLKDLPDALDLTRYFDGHPKVDPAISELLLSHPSTISSGSIGIVLAQYGIFPAQLIDVLAAISSTIKRFQRTHQLSPELPVRIGQASKDDHAQTINWMEILHAVINITDLDAVIAYRLLMWLYAVAAIKPFIIPGFIYKADPPFWWALPGGVYCSCVNSLYVPWSQLVAVDQPQGAKP